MPFKKLSSLRTSRVGAGFSIDELARRSNQSRHRLQAEEDSVSFNHPDGSLFDDREAAQIAAALSTTATTLRS